MQKHIKMKEIEGEQKTLSDAIQNLMIELKISKERAVQLLRIYQSEHGLYRNCVAR